MPCAIKPAHGKVRGRREVEHSGKRVRLLLTQLSTVSVIVVLTPGVVVPVRHSRGEHILDNGAFERKLQLFVSIGRNTNICSCVEFVARRDGDEVYSSAKGGSAKICALRTFYHL